MPKFLIRYKTSCLKTLGERERESKRERNSQRERERVKEGEREE